MERFGRVVDVTGPPLAARAAPVQIRQPFRQLLLVLLVVLFASSATAADLSGPAMVIDGDTIVIGDRHIRLYGIDAPEVRQTCLEPDGEYPCGMLASTVLAQALKGRSVTCADVGHDRYGRMIGYCLADGGDIQQAMVRLGWAVAYRKYSEVYVADENAAKLDGNGIWRGGFMMPWDWRRKHQ